MQRNPDERPKLAKGADQALLWYISEMRWCSAYWHCSLARYRCGRAAKQCGEVPMPVGKGVDPELSQELAGSLSCPSVEMCPQHRKKLCQQKPQYSSQTPIKQKRLSTLPRAKSHPKA